MWQNGKPFHVTHVYHLFEIMMRFEAKEATAEHSVKTQLSI